MAVNPGFVNLDEDVDDLGNNTPRSDDNDGDTQKTTESSGVKLRRMCKIVLVLPKRPIRHREIGEDRDGLPKTQSNGVVVNVEGKILYMYTINNGKNWIKIKPQ